MRVLAIVADVAVRDALLSAALEPVRLARLPGHPETRVIETGSGTVVIVTAGTGPLQIACTAAVAASRISPDVVLAVCVTDSARRAVGVPALVVVDGTEIPVAGPLIGATLARVPDSESFPVTGAAVAIGAAAAAAAYALPLLIVDVPDLERLSDVAGILLSADLRG